MMTLLKVGISIYLIFQVVSFVFIIWFLYHVFKKLLKERNDAH